MEMAWFNATGNMQLNNRDNYCRYVSVWRNYFQEMLHDLANNQNRGHLSYFSHNYECNGKHFIIKSMIEPLAGLLRHPFAVCGGDHFLVSREYLAIDTKSYYLQKGSRMFFDLGASMWNSGLGGSSQDFFYNTYGSRNITFTRIFLWEATPISPASLFAMLPREIYQAYQFFNIPASTNLLDPANPLNIIKGVTKPEDYVVLKIDIDNYIAENEFIRQILSDIELQIRIDELYFEHHINFEPLMQCCWKMTADMSASLHDSYRLFYKLRSLGIHAHGWP